jgi:hypothetical protein
MKRSKRTKPSGPTRPKNWYRPSKASRQPASNTRMTRIRASLLSARFTTSRYTASSSSHTSSPFRLHCSESAPITEKELTRRTISKGSKRGGCRVLTCLRASIPTSQATRVRVARISAPPTFSTPRLISLRDPKGMARTSRYSPTTGRSRINTHAPAARMSKAVQLSGSSTNTSPAMRTTTASRTG